ncbi:hypothetical protein [Haloarchaeobius sp. HRN-SO-5]|uniref:hypothetical protein n=1 Tax=Haloarchaeobius sp. HRN-SO-5 TaxID=3446118 RepID=UPI003EC00CD1
MSDTEPKSVVLEVVGLAALLVSFAVAVAIGYASFTNVLLGLPAVAVRSVATVDEPSFPLVLGSGLLGALVAVAAMLCWLYVASAAYARLEGLFR